MINRWSRWRSFRHIITITSRISTIWFTTRMVKQFHKIMEKIS